MMPGWLSFMQLAPQRWRPISSSICIPSFARLSDTISCLCSTQLGRKKLPHHEEGAMQSTDLEEIKAALWEQASHTFVTRSVRPTTSVITDAPHASPSFVVW